MGSIPIGGSVFERTVAGHVRSLLLHGKWQGNSAECPFSYQGPWSTSKQCSLSQTNDHRSACFAANAQSRVYLCVRSWNQSSRKCKSPCMNCTISMLPPPSSVVAQSRGNGPGERQRLKSNSFSCVRRSMTHKRFHVVPGGRALAYASHGSISTSHRCSQDCNIVHLSFSGAKAVRPPQAS